MNSTIAAVILSCSMVMAVFLAVVLSEAIQAHFERRQFRKLYRDIRAYLEEQDNV